MAKRIRVGCNARANEMSGLQSGVNIRTMSYKKDYTLGSPTSALEKEQMLSRLGKELGNSS
jgi:hypothetical protein